LINASAEEASFTDEEIIANAMLLLLAGHVAVRNLIGNALYLLLTHPDELAKLQLTPLFCTMSSRKRCAMNYP
jgi:cytochrome P450